MKFPPAVLAAGAALIAAAAAWSHAPASREGGALKVLPPAAPAGQQTLWGHVRSITRVGSRWELRFDPAFWTTGLTASRAQKEDTGESDVAND